MFRISDQAFGQFSQVSEIEFVEKLAEFLKANVPGMADLAGSSNLLMTSQVVQEARLHGFKLEPDIARFAVCAALLGTDFTQRFPGAAEILHMNAEPAYRARLLEYFVREMFETLEG